MAEMAVGVHGPYLGPDHAVGGVADFVHVRRNNRPGETRPSRPRVELVRGSEQWLPRDNVNVDAHLFVVVILARERPLGAGFLGDPALIGGQAVDCFLLLCVLHIGLQTLGNDPFSTTLSYRSTITVTVGLIQYLAGMDAIPSVQFDDHSLPFVLRRELGDLTQLNRRSGTRGHRHDDLTFQCEAFDLPSDQARSSDGPLR